MITSTEQILSRHYHIHNDRLAGVQPGWSALAYRAEADGKRYFLKVYDKSKYTAQTWIKAIDRYMPAVVWLGTDTPLRGRIPRVIMTADGEYKYISPYS